MALRKGAGFTGSIIRSFFSSAHQCFNSCGSGIKDLNLPIYDVSEDNDVAIMTQPLDFTCFTDTAKNTDRLHTQRASIIETPSGEFISGMLVPTTATPLDYSIETKLQAET